MSLLITPPTTRLLREAGEWYVRDLARRTSWRIDSATAATAAAFMQAREPSDVERELSSTDANAEISRRIAALTRIGLLTSPSDDVYSLNEWARQGWAEAHDYVEATWNYPFVDYSAGGQAIDRARMRQYAVAEPDEIRTLPMKGTGAVRLPDLERSLAELDNPSELSLCQRLLAIAAVAALPIETKRSRTPGADYIHRTSPSGGSRHPSEIYLLALDVPSLNRGVYHVATAEAMLGFMGDLPDDRQLKSDLHGAFRLSARPRAIFVVTTHFKRNMYRYREPRTLRTVYYDAGHLGGLVEALADDNGLIAHGHQGFSDIALAGLLRADSIAEEAPSYLVSVGLRTEADDRAIQVGKSILNARPNA